VRRCQTFIGAPEPSTRLFPSATGERQGEEAVRILAGGNHAAVVDRPFGRRARTEHPDRTEHFTMSDDATFERLRDIITNTLKVDREKVTLDASFNDDLKADSLDLVELIMAFEEEYGVEIPDEEARKITTVGAALAYVKAHGTH
jgi:acyl carrier protein